MNLKIKRLDHHGIVAGVIDDLKLVELIDRHLPQDDKQEITPGEAIKGMILNGLGFSNRPLSLTPQFFTNLPMEHLFRPGVEASHFNRHKLGRTLDQCSEFGCESLFSRLSFQACQIEQVDTQFHSLDSTSYSLSGEYKVDDEQAEEIPIQIKHGYSKDHRPDLKQVVQEMIVSQDGGVPLASKNWDGNASDNKIFRERVNALIDSFKASETPKFCVADSKLYHKENAEFLAQIRFITLIPSTIKLERESTLGALTKNDWTSIDENYKYTPLNVEHMGIKQRWLIVYSKAANERAQKSIAGLMTKEQKALEKALFHLQAQRFACETDAHRALEALNKKQKYYHLSVADCIAHKQYEGKGRPKKDAPVQSIQWQLIGKAEEDKMAKLNYVEQKSCFVLASNATEAELDNESLFQRYKAQSHVERGFRFLKDPLFFVSSLFIKKPSRIDALLMIMTLSLLVYTVGQRRLRANMAKAGITIPNQINQPIVNPTLRWVFQCFEGINLVQLNVGYQYEQVHVDGMNDVRSSVIRQLAGSACRHYKIENSCTGV
ncbi:IS1634 family transposase [Thalassomonas viridans]|uniref:IS1634 family transposase n=1 Tax=Thalassomonas viridans TaxID=137584 RepID=A0AAE9Z0K9_9GAMM|nr:IS1634 family transposase [Thalassomonas viridans]WDE03890.1 IS1634 family transposase [Thalassomonas viridans]WDE05038.1 IS1634 family transposase [Thalassomonas viridans]WDE05391.1 IS1634 family transposase [Thalassomonas viridans]WDE06872.1 IS1634 family transposase [Thalassomonas viridans]WDE08916.1 IS1634 family transposase [Thalassomonas viridans]